MFSSAELNWMRDVQEAHMMDTCVIYRVTSRTKNSRGEAVKTFAEGVTSICGVQMTPQVRTFGEGFIETDIDVILRLPLGTVVVPGDEIEITKRFGDDIEPRRYEVESYTNDGPSGCRVNLKVRNV